METNHDNPTDRETAAANEWLLHLGLDVEMGRRPWLRTLMFAPLVLGAAFLPRLIASSEPADDSKPAPPFSGTLTHILTIVGITAALLCVAAAIVTWTVCRQAHRMWLALTPEQQEAMTRQRLLNLTNALAALSGLDPDDPLGITEADLESLSSRHRPIIESLDEHIKAASAAGKAPCVTTLKTIVELLAGCLAHRVLSDDTIVNPPRDPSDHRVTVLLELDDQINTAAHGIERFASMGGCACDRVDSTRLAELGREAATLGRAGSRRG